MPVVAKDYKTNQNAPVGQWVCTRTSSLGPYTSEPPEATRNSPDYCGQCVSYPTTVCPELPVNTLAWKKGEAVKGNTAIADGTVIATFDDNTGHYHGHAAIYVSQDHTGIQVYDQWVFGVPVAIHERTIRWDGAGVANRGDGFFVVEV